MLLLAVLFRYNNYLLYYTCCEWSFWAIFSILTQDYTKFRCFIFLQVSWPRMTPVHEFSQKSETSIFSNFHDMLYFSSIFMTPGTQNFTKIWRFNFLQFSWPRYMNFHKNQKLQFSPIFMTCFIFLQFSWPRVNKITQKSDTSIFSNFHDHKITQKSDALFFYNFHDFTKIRPFNFLQFL